MIKNIVFDVGKVLVSFEPRQYLENLGYDEQTQKAVYDAMFGHTLWNETDRGVMSDEELIDGFTANAPAYGEQIREAYQKVGDTIELLPHTMKWITSLKERGYCLYIISNYGKYAYEQTKHKMEFLPYMDGTIFSYRYKIIKPDLKIYEQLLKEYHLNAEECVFIDDRLKNVEAAKEAGYQGIQFRDYAQAKLELDKLLKQ